MQRLRMVLGMTLLMFLAACATPKKHHGPGGLFDRLARMKQRPIPKWYSERSTSARAGKFKNVELSWPLKKVHVTSKYGMRGHRHHDGIDLRAKSGTRVYAAHAGRVAYASRRISGYGRMIILKHKSGLVSVYAHLYRYKVKKGQPVSRGQLIALSGASGRSTGPHLHFELRDGSKAMDPLRLLGKPGSIRLASRR